MLTPQPPMDYNHKKDEDEEFITKEMEELTTETIAVVKLLRKRYPDFKIRYLYDSALNSVIDLRFLSYELERDKILEQELEQQLNERDKLLEQKLNT